MFTRRKGAACVLLAVFLFCLTFGTLISWYGYEEQQRDAHLPIEYLNDFPPSVLEIEEERAHALQSGDWSRFTQLMFEKFQSEKGLSYDAFSLHQMDFFQYLHDNGLTFRPPTKQDGSTAVYYLLRDLFLFLLPAAVLLLTAGRIAGERGSGSIKLLLQRPKNRGKLFVGLYIKSLGPALLVIPVALLGAFLGGCVFGGPGDFRLPVSCNPLRGDHWFENPERVDGELLIPLHFLLQALPVLVLAVLFYAALGLCISVWSRSGALSTVCATVGTLGLLYFGRQVIIRTEGPSPLRYTPFAAGDPFSAVFGRNYIRRAEIDLRGAQMGLPGTLEIPNPVPYWGECLLLAAGAALLFTAGLLLFRRKDLA